MVPYQWSPMASAREYDTFKLMTKHDYLRFFSPGQTLCCLVFFSNKPYSAYGHQTSNNNKQSQFRWTYQFTNKCFFFSDRPDYDFDTFLSRHSIETKFPFLKLKYQIVLPLLETTQPVNLPLCFNVTWDRRELPSNYSEIVQKLCKHKIKVQIYDIYNFNLYTSATNEEVRVHISESSVTTTVCTPFCLHDLIMLFDYVYVIAYALICSNTCPRLMNAQWIFEKGVYNDNHRRVPNSVTCLDMFSKYIRVPKKNLRLQLLCQAKISCGLHKELYTILKSI